MSHRSFRVEQIYQVDPDVVTRYVNREPIIYDGNLGGTADLIRPLYSLEYRGFFIADHIQ